MSIIDALGRKPIAILWSGLVFSSVGDELFTVALLWLATETLGAMAGYLVAVQALVTMLAGLFAGVITDDRDPRRMMIASDLVRALAVLAPPVWTVLSGTLPPIGLLAVTIFAVSAAKPFFDPSLQACLPHLADSTRLLQSVNALFDAMRRTARVIGPAVAAGLMGLVPIIHFFTIDALTFVVSAGAIAYLRTPLMATMTRQPHKEDSVAKARRLIFGGFTALNRIPSLRFHVFAFGVQSGAWYVGLMLALALRIQETHPADFYIFGLVVAAYGVGNIVSNILVAEAGRPPSYVAMSAGRVLLGIGFICLAASSSLAAMALSAAFAAAGAPVTQIPLTTLMQTSFGHDQIQGVYRVRMIAEWSGVLVALLLSPLIVKALGSTGTIATAGIVYLLLGMVGFVRDRHIQGRPTTKGHRP